MDANTDHLLRIIEAQKLTIESLTTEVNLLRDWFKMEARYIEVMCYAVGTPEREFYENLYKEIHGRPTPSATGDE